VADPCKTKKTPVQRVRCFSALSSGLTQPTPPPPMKNARRAVAAGHKTTQRRRRPPVRRRTALIEATRTVLNNSNRTVLQKFLPVIDDANVYFYVFLFHVFYFI